MELASKLIRRLLYLIFSLTSLLLLVFVGVFTYNSKETKPLEEKNELVEWDPTLLILENPEVSPQIKKGYLLVAESSKYMGPMAQNSLDQYSGNNLSCTNCHLNGGTQTGSASWIGIRKRFPQYGGRADKIGTLEDRINGCMERSMNGKKLPEKSEQMEAILAYMSWLSSDFPKVNEIDFEGYPTIEIPGFAVNLEQGKSIYQKECALCHGTDGEGVRYLDSEMGYQYPPLWGEDSYNNGAGMHRVLTAAAFIKSNMPYLQAKWDAPKLTDEEAFHVAGYINSFSRPQKKNTEFDYPDKKKKPVSTPYGPWTDPFSAEQHKYGPFPPIIAYYKTNYNLNKNK